MNSVYPTDGTKLDEYDLPNPKTGHKGNPEHIEKLAGFAINRLTDDLNTRRLAYAVRELIHDIPESLVKYKQVIRGDNAEVEYHVRLTIKELTGILSALEPYSKTLKGDTDEETEKEKAAQAKKETLRMQIEKLQRELEAVAESTSS